MRHTFRVAWFFLQDLSLFFKKKREVSKRPYSFVYKSAREAANALCLLERAQLLSSRPPARHPSFRAPSFWVSVASPLERDRGGGGETRRIVFACRVVKIKRLESREKSVSGLVVANNGATTAAQRSRRSRGPDVDEEHDIEDELGRGVERQTRREKVRRERIGVWCRHLSVVES